MSFIMRPIRFAPTGHIIAGSGLFDGSSGYLSRTPASNGDERQGTIEFIVKPSEFADTMLAYQARAGGVGTAFWVYITSSYQIRVMCENDGGTAIINHITTPVFRDPSAYYHIVVNFDGDTTGNGCVNIYVNGTQITDFGTRVNLSTATDLNLMNSTKPVTIGFQTGAASYLDGYLSRATYIDGQALDPTSFGEVTDDGFWQINDVSELTFGTNGFLIEGGSAISAGTDSSGNSNNFSKTGTIISTLDSPTNSNDGYGNYCTLSPLWQTRSGTSKSILSNGNLTVKTNGSTIGEALGSIAADSSGKSTYETTVTAVGSICIVGFAGSTYIDGNATFRVAWRNNGIVYFGSSSTYSSSDTYTTGDVVRCELNMTTGALQFFKNGTLASDASSPSFAMHTNVQDSGWLPYIGLSTNASSGVTCNFGASSFAATPTSNFLPIATQNLSTPAPINYQDEYYILADIGHTTGTTTDVHLPKTVSGGAMVRIKRTNTTGGWYVFDTVRGANKFQFWDTNTVEDTSTFSDQNLTGSTFTIPSGMASGSYLLECFFVGSYFQIKAYTGTGSAHAESFPAALDTVPGFGAIFNRTEGSMGRIGWHSSVVNTKYMTLSGTDAASTLTAIFNSTDPTTTAFTIGTWGNVNNNNKTYIAYYWANSGPYAFGSYTGNNNNADGPMINLGGSPKQMTVKATTNTTAWFLQTTTVDTFNEMSSYLQPNATNAVASGATTKVDYVSSGVKGRWTSASLNAAANFIYMAYGIQPLTDSAINQVRADGRGSAPLAIATGGTITLDGDYAINTFNASGTLIFSKAPVGGVEYLVIAGGGGGGANYRAGGGGGGGYRTATGLAVEAINYAITVGAGGAGGSNTTAGTNGGNSVFSSITSAGGGGGGAYNSAAAKAGGSGGGSAGHPSTNTVPGAASPAGQGNAGGDGFVGTTQIGGGGGGAGAVGFDGTSGGTGGDGGAGLASSITGSEVFRAGGGGAGAYGGGNNFPVGGVGGGANGIHQAGRGNGPSASANTGGGGGGSSGTNTGSTGGTGGSGVVIVRYKYK